ncbi:MAG: hypothetical protein IIW25_00445 [Bacteroidales bacterium]|nr:hypothetical protein [Bacteroidales bacterium]
MNLSDLSNLLRQLLSENDEVSLPGMGHFVIVDIPSELINGGKAITPPSRKIVFESSDGDSEKLLVLAYCRERGISENDAAKELSELLRQFKKELVDNAGAEIPGFGRITFGAGGSFVFEADDSFDVAADSYCLETLPLKIMNDQQPVEEEFVIDSMDIEMADPEENEQLDELKNVDDSEPEKLQPETVEKEDAIVPENPEETENPTEQEKPAEIVEQPVRETLVAEAEKQKCRWILWVAAFVGILIILVILVFLFKEELMPLLEKLLYSKEELEILHKVGR